MTLTRGQIIAEWFDVTSGTLTAAGGVAHAVGRAALQASYSARTVAAAERLGEHPYWVFISQTERDKAADSGAAMPDGSYPITTCDGDNSVDTAIGAVGRGGADHDAIRRHIIKRADSLGCSAKIPGNWNPDGSIKDEAAASAGGTSFTPPPPPPPPSAPKAAEPTPQTPGAKAPPAKPPTEAKDAESGSTEGEDAADDAVTAALKDVEDALSRALKAQQTDDPEGDDAADAKVQAGLEQLKTMLDKVVADQAADKGRPEPEDAPAAAHKPPKAPPAPAKAPAMTAAGGLTPGNQEGVPGDADDSPPGPGDIEATVVCENPQCGHPASSHEDLPDGKNTGACAECDCVGMVPHAHQVVGPSDTSAPAAPPAPAAAGAEVVSLADALARNRALADTPPADAEPQAPPIEGAPVAALPPLDPMPDVVMGAEFTVPVAWLEEVPTGDGRIVGQDSLTWRTPPLPLMGMKTSSHDPSGMSPNDPAVLIGRIESVERDGNKGVARGHLLNTEDGTEWAEILEQMGRMGVSIDVGGATVSVEPDPTIPAQDVILEPGMPPPGLFDMPLVERITAGEVMGMTVCPFAAFAGAYIVLGDGSNVPEAELPAAPAAAKMAVRLVDEVPCEPCAAGALVASGGATTSTGGPVAPPASWFEDPTFAVGDPRLVETIDSKTGRPSGKFACPLTVTEDGRVFGHIAQWGVCHQSPRFINSGQCVMAPRSRTDYAVFHTGQVLTAEGTLIDVGRISADAGHASEHAQIGAAQALAHYDNSALTAAFVRAGEDEFGIWVAGSIHPAASAEQVATLRGNPPSGDWRAWGSGQELCGVLAVNVPGFPMVRATMRDGRLTSLVAAGVPMFEVPTTARPEPSVEDRVAALERGYRPMAELAAVALHSRMEAARAG